ncbi:hypothetical protein HYALB_00010929 [Hymenoscyphus albidus]|uniref:Uncharacterized protein n=1 Tax=Hymenoscyphus albidus TaxID=595503 RepID=A0A9N9LHJ0_9HELO|nr:hypothetical protein HYALB_00010929 [Hymenoscyphus albidus]
MRFSLALVAAANILALVSAAPAEAAAGAVSGKRTLRNAFEEEVRRTSKRLQEPVPPPVRKLAPFLDLSRPLTPLLLLELMQPMDTAVI